MSAIIAGNKCKLCGKSFWHSFGSTRWWRDYVIHNKPKSPEYIEYEKIRDSGMCLSCFTKGLLKETF